MRNVQLSKRWTIWLNVEMAGDVFNREKKKRGTIEKVIDFIKKYDVVMF